MIAGTPMPSASGAQCRLLACSPRKGGNTDEAARLFARAYAAALGGEAGASILYLREHRVEPCIACGACTHMAEALKADAKEAARLTVERLAAGPGRERGRFPPFGCPLALKDDSAGLLRALATAPALCLVAPVYFYHLPAALKGLLDRTQSFWALREKRLSPFFRSEKRPCHVILVGARSQGEQLFAGSLLTLRYALGGLGLRVEQPLLLYGLDEPGDLAADARARARITAYAEEAAASCGGREEKTELR